MKKILLFAIMPLLLMGCAMKGPIEFKGNAVVENDGRAFKFIDGPRAGIRYDHIKVTFIDPLTLRSYGGEPLMIYFHMSREGGNSAAFIYATSIPLNEKTEEALKNKRHWLGELLSSFWLL